AAQVLYRVRETRLVEDVEGFDAQLKSAPVVPAELAAYGDIGLRHAESGDRIPAEAALHARFRRLECRGVYAQAAWRGCIHHPDWPAQNAVGTECVGERDRLAMIVLEDRNREAATYPDNRIDPPAPQKAAQPGSWPRREFVGHGGCQGVPQVEIGGRAVALRARSVAGPFQESITRSVIDGMRPGIGYQRLKTLENAPPVLHLQPVVVRRAVIRGQREQCGWTASQPADLPTPKTFAYCL